MLVLSSFRTCSRRPKPTVGCTSTRSSARSVSPRGGRAWAGTSHRKPPRGRQIVFPTAGRAIGYAESVVGYIAHRKLGTIVGSATAGANGNGVVFVVPGGFRIGFTGMRVTGHDGQAPHHLVGSSPTFR